MTKHTADWLTAERHSSRLLARWNISSITQEAASILMQEDYESLYIIIRFKAFGCRAQKLFETDYPVYSSSGDMVIPIKSGVDPLQLQLLIFNSSNMKLHVAESSGIHRNPFNEGILPAYFSHFAAYTDYGDEPTS